MGMCMCVYFLVDGREREREREKERGRERERERERVRESYCALQHSLNSSPAQDSLWIPAGKIRIRIVRVFISQI